MTMMVKLVHKTYPITSIINSNSLDRSQKTRRNVLQYGSSKMNQDQLKQYFNASDLAVYKPKKDLCGIFTGYDVGNIQYNAYHIHNNEEERGSALRKKYNDLSLTSDNIGVIYSHL